MRRVVLLVHAAIVVLSAGLSPNSAFAQDATDTKPATIWYSEQFIFHSRSLERDFLIQVAKSRLTAYRSRYTSPILPGPSGETIS